HSIVNSLLHNPIVNLKGYANTNHGHLYTEILQNLFSLEVEGQRSKKHPEVKPAGPHCEGMFVHHGNRK
ncbi:MAG: hypothetical protein ACYC4E_01915, partial [Carboxydocellales bacterium]